MGSGAVCVMRAACCVLVQVLFTKWLFLHLVRDLADEPDTEGPQVSLSALLSTLDSLDSTLYSTLR